MSEHGVLYKARGQRTGMIVIGVLFPLFVLPSFLSSGVEIGWLLFWAALVAVYSCFFVFRLSKMGAYAFESELVIKNPFRTVHVRWDQIDHFTHGRFGIILKVGAVLRSGEVVPIAGLPVSAAGLGGSTKVAFDELNARVGHTSES